MESFYFELTDDAMMLFLFVWTTFLAIFSVGGSQLDFTLEAVPDLSCKHFPAATHVLFVVTVATGEMNRNDDI